MTLAAVIGLAVTALLGVVVIRSEDSPRTTEVATGNSSDTSESPESSERTDTTSTTTDLLPQVGAAETAATTTTARPAGAPAAAATAPVFMSAVADAIAGIVTITFDQPVELANALGLVVFSTDATCGTPQGNAHALITGGGTPTITVEATSFVPGTNFIRIASGLVVGARGKLPNNAVGCTAVSGGSAAAPRYKTLAVDAGAGTVTVGFDQSVEPGDATKLVLFGNDASCSTPASTASTVAAAHDRRSVVASVAGLASGTVYLRIGKGLVIGTHGFIANEPAPCVRAEAVVPPVLRSARASTVGDLAGGTTLVLTFDQPVRAGHIDMYVILYDEAGCNGPNGNSHELLAGDGTDTITVDVSGYVAGVTNYLRISPGFVKAVDDGTPNAGVPCTVITTS